VILRLPVRILVARLCRPFSLLSRSLSAALHLKATTSGSVIQTKVSCHSLPVASGTPAEFVERRVSLGLSHRESISSTYLTVMAGCKPVLREQRPNAPFPSTTPQPQNRNTKQKTPIAFNVDGGLNPGVALAVSCLAETRGINPLLRDDSWNFLSPEYWMHPNRLGIRSHYVVVYSPCKTTETYSKDHVCDQETC
jgi:hypothetical protein